MLNGSIMIRRAGLADLDFIYEADLLAEGFTFDPLPEPLTPEEKVEYRQRLERFLTTADEAGWIAEDIRDGQRAGMIVVRFRDLKHEPPSDENLFLLQFFDPSIFPPDGRFCEIFNLWVHPAYRRRGLATCLKLAAEGETRARGVGMIYTHTEAGNPHVLDLNLKLGYEVIRTGPLWDNVPRVSLIKKLSV